MWYFDGFWDIVPPPPPRKLGNKSAFLVVLVPKKFFYEGFQTRSAIEKKTNKTHLFSVTDHCVASGMIFEIVEFETIVKIEPPPFLNPMGPIFSQNLSVTRKRLVTRLRGRHHCVSVQLLLMNTAFVRKFWNFFFDPYIEFGRFVQNCG